MLEGRRYKPAQRCTDAGMIPIAFGIRLRATVFSAVNATPFLACAASWGGAPLNSLPPIGRQLCLGFIAKCHQVWRGVRWRQRVLLPKCGRLIERDFLGSRVTLGRVQSQTSRCSSRTTSSSQRSSTRFPTSAWATPAAPTRHRVCGTDMTTSIALSSAFETSLLMVR